MHGNYHIIRIWSHSQYGSIPIQTQSNSHNSGISSLVLRFSGELWYLIFRHNQIRITILLPILLQVPFVPAGSRAESVHHPITLSDFCFRFISSPSNLLELNVPFPPTVKDQNCTKDGLCPNTTLTLWWERMQVAKTDKTETQIGTKIWKYFY